MSLERVLRKNRDEDARDRDVNVVLRTKRPDDLKVRCPVCDAPAGQMCVLPQIGAVHLVRRRTSDRLRAGKGVRR